MERWGSGLVMATIVAMAAGLIGCGSTESSSDPLSAAEYAQRATTICDKAAERREEGLQQAIGAHGRSEAESDAVKVAAEVLAPVYRDMIDELSALEIPVGKKGREYEVWVKTFEELLQKSEADHSWFLKPYVGPHHKAKSAGLPACAAI
jgi:hypothetical protein